MNSDAKHPCECTIPSGGQCPRHGVNKSARWAQLCRAGGNYWAAWEAGFGPGQQQPAQAKAWDSSQPSRGLGDTVARIAKPIQRLGRKLLRKIGVKVNDKPCSGCDKRQAALNRWLPYRQRRHEAAANDSTIRVGLLTPVLTFGGAERWVASLAAGLGVGPGASPRIEVAGVAVRDRGKIFPPLAAMVEGRPGCTLTQGAASIRTLAAQCDVVIAWGLPNLSMLRGYPGRVVMVSHGHCDWTVAALRKSIDYVTNCAAVSRHATLSFREAGINTSRVAVIHNGIDDARCQPTQSREAVRAAWGLSPGEIAVGHVGRICNEQKNIEAVVRAVARLGAGYRLVMAGDVDVRRAEVQRWRKILPNLIAVPTVDHVGDVYRALDCFALASRFEGFSLALAEAWFCGCPTVSTPVGATELEEEHGPLTISVPVDCSPDVLAAGIRRALAAENTGTVLRASRVVAEHYTAAAMCRRWESYLERIVDAHQHRGAAAGPSPLGLRRGGAPSP